MSTWARVALLSALVLTGARAQDDLPPEPPPAPPPLDDPGAPGGEPEAPPVESPRLPPGPFQVRPSSGAAGAARLDIDVEAVSLAEVMAAIGRRARVTIGVDPAVEESVTVSLRDIPWREAVDVIARMTRCRVEDLPGGGLWVVQPTAVTLSVTDADVRDVAATIARVAGERVIVLPDAGGRVSVDLKEVPWRDALAQVARAAGLQVTARSGLTIVSKSPLPGLARAPWRPAADGPRVDVSADGAHLSDVIEAIGRLAGRNILVHPSVVELVSLDVVGAPWQVGVHLLARQTGCDVEAHPQGFFVLTRAPEHAIQAVGAPAAILLQMLAAYAGRNVVVGPGVDGLVSADLSGVDFTEGLRLLAVLQGWRLELGTNDSVVVTAPSPRPEPPLPTTPYEADVAKLVDDVARFARERRVAELEAAMAALRERVSREAGQPPVAARATDEHRADLEVIEAELEDLLRQVVRLAEARLVEELIERFTAFRQVLHRGGPAALPVARRLLEKWERRLEHLGEVKLSLRLQLELQAGNAALGAMADALRAGDWAAVRAAGDEIDETCERMRNEEREVFHRNAEALFLKGKALRDRAARLERIDRDFGALLRVTAIVVPDDRLAPKSAIVGGEILREGDGVVDPGSGEPIDGLRVVEITRGAVRFRFEDTEVVRELGR